MTLQDDVLNVVVNMIFIQTMRKHVLSLQGDNNNVEVCYWLFKKHDRC